MAVNIEKALRGINSEEKIFRNAKRVSVIKAVDCIITLSKLGLDSQTIKVELQKLLEQYKLARVKLSEKNPGVVDIAISKNLNASDYYMWVEDSYDYGTLLLSLLCVVAILGLVMYRIWPPWMKIIGKYAQYFILFLIAALLFISIVRLIIYLISYLIYPSGFWLFPNLFAECGIIESFIPFSAWDNEELLQKKE
ncbi:Translocation protein S62 [Glugoides intestinalis]